MEGSHGKNAVWGFQTVLTAKLSGFSGQFNIQGYHKQGLQQPFNDIFFCVAQTSAAEQFDHGDGGNIERRTDVKKPIQHRRHLGFTGEVVNNGVRVEGVQRLTAWRLLIPFSTALFNLRNHLGGGLLPNRLSTMPQRASLFRWHKRVNFPGKALFRGMRGGLFHTMEFIGNYENGQLFHGLLP